MQSFYNKKVKDFYTSLSREQQWHCWDRVVLLNAFQQDFIQREINKIRRTRSTIQELERLVKLRDLKIPKGWKSVWDHFLTLNLENWSSDDDSITCLYITL